MNIYFVVQCMLWCMALGSSLGRHGKPKEGKENFYSTLIAVVIEFWLVCGAIQSGF